MSKEEVHKLVYGQLSKKEAEILVHGKGNYKGWRCPEIGGGRVLMKKKNQELVAYSNAGPDEWVMECWKDLKQQIDDIEAV